MQVVLMEDDTLLVLGRNVFNNLGRYCDMTGRNGFPSTNDRGWRVIDDNGATLVVNRGGFSVEVELNDITNLY